MIRFLYSFIVASILTSCSNAPELETGEIKALAMLEQAFNQSKEPKRFVNAKLLLTREQVDEAQVPILYVELPSGQNGTLTLYPGKGIGETWLGADGATVALEMGVLKASRGMGDDLMGSTSSMPQWSKIENEKQIYNRELGHITGNNKILKRSFKCEIQKIGKKEIIKIWDINFKVTQFDESCRNRSFKFKNTYYIDANGIVRRSLQYHSNTIGYILIERLDR